MDVFVLYEFLVEERIDQMRLIWVHIPTQSKIKLLILQLLPCSFLYHKLPTKFSPSLLPIQTSVINDHSHIVNSSVVTNQTKPTSSHCPKFIFILNQTIIIQFILIKRTLLIECYWVGWTQFVNWNYVLFHTLNLHIALD